LNTIYLKNII